MLEYVKPNGTEVTINDSKMNIDFAESLGWKPKKEIKEVKPKPVKKIK